MASLAERFASHIKRNAKCGCSSLCAEVRTALHDERQANERLRAAVKDLRAMVLKLVTPHGTTWTHEQPGRAEASTLLASTADLEGA